MNDMGKENDISTQTMYVKELKLRKFWSSILTKRSIRKSFRWNIMCSHSLVTDGCAIERSALRQL